MEEEVVSEFNRQQVLHFRLGDENYAVDINTVQSIIDSPSLTPVPNTPSFVLGLLNDRGSVKPVIDLSLLFGLKEGEGNLVITLNVDEMYVGLRADSVEGVAEVDFSQLQPPPPSLHGVEMEYIIGVLPYKRVILTILDIGLILQHAKERIEKF